MAYQSAPVMANFLTISEVCQDEDGSWAEDLSHEYTVKKS